MKKDRRQKDYSGNKQILQLTYFYSVLFLVLIFYVSFFVYKDSDTVINNSYNKREGLYAEKVVRGSILASNGETLAYTDTSKGKEVRVYPYGPAFAHVVGYNVKGKSGLESACTFKLLTSNVSFSEKISNETGGIKNPGNNIVTTLDVDAQMAAYSALGNNKGAVVLMDAKTGDILAMVSKPDFDPNNIEMIWDDINSSNGNSMLLNRATQGLYPPGSTFKIVTALEYIKENRNINKYEFNCNGSFSYNGTTINCYHGTKHGESDFVRSFAKSCNSSFANITTSLDKSKFKKTCEELMFNSPVPCPLNASVSYVPVTKSSAIDELIQTGIGQGKSEITPYHMCLISSAIANDGILMTPKLVKYVETVYGDEVSSSDDQEYKRLISSEDSDKLKMLMREVITQGTGTNLLNTYGYTAYGKTGSAEFSSNKKESHAWFTGFAVTDKGRTVAISVIVENGGSGGQTAVPVAKAVFDAYLYKYIK